MVLASAPEKSLLHLLHRAVQVGTDRFATALGDNGLTARQLVILKAIAANDGASQTVLVDITGVDRSTLADMMKRLINHKLVARKRSKADARAYQVTLTEQGRQVMKMAEPLLRAVERDMLAVIPVKQRGELLASLTALMTVP